MSSGGAVPNSPRHFLIVSTCCKFSSSKYATMHRTLGSSPLLTSYSKSATTTRSKLLTNFLRAANQAQQCWMILASDAAALECSLDQFRETRCWPLRFFEGIRILRVLNVITLHTFVASACDLHPAPPGLPARRRVIGVPLVVHVTCGDRAEEEQIIRFGG